MGRRMRWFAVALVPTLAVATLGSRFVRVYNGAIEAEAELQQAWRDSQVAYDDLWKSVSEATQVTDAYEDDFRKVLHGSLAITSRDSFVDAVLFGLDADLDPGMYRGLHRQIDAGRSDYVRAQARVSAGQAAYRVQLERFPDVLVARALGLPRPVDGAWAPEEDLDGDGVLTVLDYPVVTSTRTRTVYASGIDDELLAPPP